jgi:putative flippase GtrA
MIKPSETTKRYIVIGLSVYVLELLIIFLAEHLGANAVSAVGISFWVGLVTSFGLQKLITFKDRRLHHKVVLKQAFLFSLLVLFNFGFTIGLTKLLESYMPAALIRTLAIGISTCWNFVLYKKGIFKTEGNIVY